MKKILAITLFATAAIAAKAQIYTGKTVKVDFYSHTPVEDIKAKTPVMTTVVNFGTNDFAFKIPVKTFDFPNDLMEEHFNENYLETAKYPNATFSGKMDTKDKIDVSKDGVYSIIAEGVLEVHGVKQNRSIPATITIKNGVITIDAKFKIHLADHKIDVPSIVTAKIAEDIDVTVNAVLQKYK
jgi:polyisoprenoid-binding protein YceI